jgi:DNA-directed RNA polymerase specialized sigma24 family protein
VEVMGRYLNPSDQGERLRQILEIAPTGSQGATLRTPKRVFRRLEPDKIAELVRGYVDGRRVDEFASEFQINRSTVSCQLDRAGVARRWRKLQQADVQEAKRLYASGLSLAKVAGHFGVHASTVHSALRKAAVRMRDTQGGER